MLCAFFLAPNEMDMEELNRKSKDTVGEKDTENNEKNPICRESITRKMGENGPFEK